VRLMNVDGEASKPVNLGNPSEVTIAELAKLIVSLVGSQSAIEFRKLPLDDPRQRCPDISRARELLHWRPQVALEDGLGRTIAYFDHLLSRNSAEVQLLRRRAVH